MDQEKKQAIALMRYSAIAPLITGLSDDYESLTAFFNNASVKGVIHPDGTLKHYAPGTIEKWYRNYKQSGFDALIPTGREDQWLSSLDIRDFHSLDELRGNLLAHVQNYNQTVHSSARQIILRLCLPP